MTRIAAGICAITIVAFATPSVRADSISLQEIGINVNGTVTDNGAGGDPYTVAGVNAGGWDTATGLGTITFAFNPGVAGTYFVDFFLDPGLSVPFFNEYAEVDGSLPAGSSYQIDDPFAGTIYDNFSNNTLDDTNAIPGTVDNYDTTCSGASCNGDPSLALGFSFVLGVGESAVVTVNGSTSNPGGFSLHQIHPVDPEHASPVDYYLNGNVDIVSGNPVVPEPGSGLLLGLGAALLGASALRRRFVRL